MRRPLKQPHKNEENLFEELPDDVVVFILTKLSSTASSSSHFLNILSTCKRFKQLGLHPLVLSKAGSKVLFVHPKKWCDNSHRFLKRCVDAGSVEAFYTLGMIRFYCLQNRKSGLSLIAKAAMKMHAPALYSLAVIQFNGSGGSKHDKDLRAGAALSARASSLGHIDALREFGHCLQDGYGVKQNVTEGRRLLVQANIRELLLVLRAVVAESPSRAGFCQEALRSLKNLAVPLINTSNNDENGYNVTVPEVHPVNWFLRQWFESGRGTLEEGLRLCAHIGCGRVEMRPHEFRRCSVCGTVNYCSRGCQSLDWKLRHKMECSPLEGWLDENNGGGDDGPLVGGGGGDENHGNDVAV
ncbi:F-box protein At5g50450-like [Vicia villosa]|uniref:F-box protein At5g50450-like n=1 Tax=Vicia villosa TaxID=3911 RepID=UPI00273C3A67|nr:F-box protein At5g50450-like [Vicia villosa]